MVCNNIKDLDDVAVPTYKDKIRVKVLVLPETMKTSRRTNYPVLLPQHYQEIYKNDPLVSKINSGSGMSNFLGNLGNLAAGVVGSAQQ